MHDKNGNPICIGDEVVIKGKVTGQTSGDGNFCSMEVQIEGDWDGKGGTAKNWFSAKQVEIVDFEPELSNDAFERTMST